MIVKMVVQVRLLPTPEQAAALEATSHACNEAASWVSEVAFERGEFKDFALRKHTYDNVRSRWNLGAQAVQHTVKKACDAYTTLKANLKAGNLGKPGSKRYRQVTEKPIAFRPHGAQPYEDRMLSWQAHASAACAPNSGRRTPRPPNAASRSGAVRVHTSIRRTPPAPAPNAAT
ncbi:hypothetical protein ACFWFF_39630 [Streptomyces sp. NPDC060223]|uniref:hypothetical protein n=1 Tax=unclassified Streptomyces TaxID=2593676 RepID=UPI00364203A9